MKKIPLILISSAIAIIMFLNSDSLQSMGLPLAKTMVTDLISSEDSPNYIIYDLFERIPMSYRYLKQLKLSGYRTNQKMYVEFYPRSRYRTLDIYIRHQKYVNKVKTDGFYLMRKSRFDSQGRLTVSQDHAWDDTFEITTTEHLYEYKYNDKNLLIEGIGYDNNGFIDHKFYYKYDNLNRLIHKASNLTDNAKFTFDGNGNLIEYLWKSDGRYIPNYRAKYTADNRKLEHFFYDTSGEVYNRFVCRLDQGGNIIEETDETLQAPTAISVIKNKFDAYRNKIESEIYSGTNRSGMLFEDKISYKYYGKFLVERNHYHTDGQLTKTFRFQYDANGNLISQEEYYPGEDYKCPVKKYAAKYDLKSNRILEEINFEAANDHETLLQSESITYKYNRDWYLTEYTTYGAVYSKAEVPAMLEKYLYIYDDSNNIIQCEYYNAGTEPSDTWILKYDGKFHRNNNFRNLRVIETPVTEIQKTNRWLGKPEDYQEDFRD